MTRCCTPLSHMSILSARRAPQPGFGSTLASTHRGGKSHYRLLFLACSILTVLTKGKAVMWPLAFLGDRLFTWLFERKMDSGKRLSFHSLLAHLSLRSFIGIKSKRSKWGKWLQPYLQVLVDTTTCFPLQATWSPASSLFTAPRPGYQSIYDVQKCIQQTWAKPIRINHPRLLALVALGIF